MLISCGRFCVFFFFQAEDGIRDADVTGVQTCALPILVRGNVRLESAGAFQVVGAADGQVVAGAKLGVSQLTSVDTIDISTQEGAQSAISVLDSAIASIDKNRASLGAIQNRFESTISNLQNISENVSAARSRIMDTDYAAESANLTKYQIMQQAGTAMLAQANQLPQAVLSLLG